MGKGKRIPMSPEMVQVVEHQIEAFRKKFHREMGPDDPLLFDPEADTPQPISEAKMAAMFEEIFKMAAEADTRPEILYAMRKTGRIVTTKNRHLLSPEESAEWNAAIDEYHSLQ